MRGAGALDVRCALYRAWRPPPPPPQRSRKRSRNAACWPLGGLRSVNGNRWGTWPVAPPRREAALSWTPRRSSGRVSLGRRTDLSGDWSTYWSVRYSIWNLTNTVDKATGAQHRSKLQSPWGFSEMMQLPRHECHVCYLLRAEPQDFQHLVGNTHSTHVKVIAFSFRKTVRGS